MQPSHKLTHALLALLALVFLSSSALAADPGLPIGTSAVSDQKVGSLLIYNIYSSSVTNPNAGNTRISITNTNPTDGVAVHLFLVDGSNCSVADSFLCLTKSQTMSFLASDVDPGVTGYIVALAVDAAGLPLQFNFLIGSEYVRLESGHQASLGAEAFAKINNTNVVSTDGSLAALFFDGLPLAGSYDRAPRVLAVDDIPSPADGNDTLLVINRVGGNLGIGAATLGNLFGILFDQLENPFSFTFSGPCQFRGSISNTFPLTTPRVGSIIPAGSSGWMKFYSQSDIGIIGAVLNRATSVAPSTSAFNGGRNLHKLTFSAAANYVIPVFAGNCGFTTLTAGVGD